MWFRVYGGFGVFRDFGTGVSDSGTSCLRSQSVCAVQPKGMRVQCRNLMKKPWVFIRGLCKISNRCCCRTRVS